MNRKKWLLILWSGLMLIVLFQLIITDYYYPDRHSLWDIFISIFGGFFTGILLIFTLLIPVFDFSITYKKIYRLIFLTLFSIIYSFIYIFILFAVPYLFKDFDFNTYYSYVIDYSSNNFHNIMKNYIFQIAVLYAHEYFTNEANLIEQKKNLEVELNNTKLKILKSQLQPHFLFNSLNSIVSVIDENKLKAQNMIIKLSDILRTTLNADFQKFSSLEDELIFIENYLKIEKMRFEDQLEYNISISDKEKKLKLPTLILQPIIENSINHGFKGLKHKLTILIYADYEKKIIYVENNGKSLDSKPAQFNTGLKNVSERLEIFYNKKNNFKIYMRDNYIVNEIILE